MKKLLSILGTLIFTAVPAAGTISCTNTTTSDKKDLKFYNCDFNDQIINLAQFATIGDLENMMVQNYVKILKEKISDKITSADVVMKSFHNGSKDLRWLEGQSTKIIDISQSLTMNFQANSDSKYVSGTSELTAVDSNHLTRGKTDINGWSFKQDSFDNSKIQTGKQLFKSILENLNNNFRQGLVQIKATDIEMNIKHNGEIIDENTTGINLMTGNFEIEFKANHNSEILTGSTSWSPNLQVYDLASWKIPKLNYKNDSQSSNADFIKNYIPSVISKIGPGVTDDEYSFTVNTRLDKTGNEISETSSTNIADVASAVYVDVIAPGSTATTFSHLLKAERTITINLTGHSSANISDWKLPLNTWDDQNILQDLKTDDAVKAFSKKQYYDLVQNKFITDDFTKKEVNANDFIYDFKSITGTGTESIDVQFSVKLNPDGNAFKNNILIQTQEVVYSVNINDKRVDISDKKLPPDFIADIWSSQNYLELSKQVRINFSDSLIPATQWDIILKELSVKFRVNYEITDDINKIRRVGNEGGTIELQFSTSKDAITYYPDKTTQWLKTKYEPKQITTV